MAYGRDLWVWLKCVWAWPVGVFRFSSFFDLHLWRVLSVPRFPSCLGFLWLSPPTTPTLSAAAWSCTPATETWTWPSSTAVSVPRACRTRPPPLWSDRARTNPPRATACGSASSPPASWWSPNTPTARSTSGPSASPRTRPSPRCSASLTSHGTAVIASTSTIWPATLCCRCCWPPRTTTPCGHPPRWPPRPAGAGPRPAVSRRTPAPSTASWSCGGWIRWGRCRSRVACRSWPGSTLCTPPPSRTWPGCPRSSPATASVRNAWEKMILLLGVSVLFSSINMCADYRWYF